MRGNAVFIKRTLGEFPALIPWGKVHPFRARYTESSVRTTGHDPDPDEGFADDMLLIRLMIILFGVTWATGLCARTWSPVTDEYRRADYQSDGLGWSATQLPDGRLMFGFDSIVTFDGRSWRQHPVSGTYALRALAPAGDGRVWVGGLDDVGYLTESRGVFTYHSLSDKLPEGVRGEIGDIWYVFADGPGHAVYVANEHVLRWDGNTFEVHHLPGRRRLSAFLHEGRIHIGHRPAGVSVLTDSGFETVLPTEAVEGLGIVWMGRLAGELVAATTSGLRRVENGRLVPQAPQFDDLIRESVLTCATPLADGRLALGTMKSGVLLIDPSNPELQPFGIHTGLPADSVHALFQDHEGWLWVVSPARLQRIWPERSVSIFQPPQPEAFPATALAPLGNGVLIATDTGLWHTSSGAASARGMLTPVAGANDRMLSLLPVPDGVLVGHRGGLSLATPSGGFELHQQLSGHGFALAHDPDGGTLVAHDRQLVLWNGDTLTPIGQPLPDVATSVAALTRDQALAGTWLRGLVAVGETDAAVQALVELLANEPGATFVARAGGRIFAVRGRKIAALEPDGRILRAPEPPEGFEPRALHAATADTAWLAGERRFSDGSRAPLLQRIAVRGAQLEATVLRFDVLNRAGSPRSLTTDSRSPETLWIGGDLALLSVDADTLRPASPPEPPQIRLVSGTVRREGHDLLMPHRNNRIELEIISHEPARRDDLRLETLLVGGETEWSEPRDVQTISLTNLQSGSYAVRARYLAPDGSRSTSSEFAFIVAPPWWLTGWAIALEVIGAGLTVLVIVRVRVRSLRRKAAHLEKLVAERTAELVHASQAKTEFVSSMSHELRNPLNGIVATAYALGAAPLDDEHQRHLSTLRHCAGLLDALIGDVLDFSEIESGRITLKPVEYAPADLIAAAVGVIQPVAQRKGIELRVDIENDLPSQATGDASRLQQVLLNLMGNAVKFSERGEVRLSVRHVAPAGEERLQFTVQDQGPGIPPAERNSLFEKFSRTSYAREHAIPGTGLGLAVCRQLVERMGGRIWLVDTPGPGATFSFEVPLRLEGATPVGAPSPGTSPLPRTALIVEDLDYNARAMVAMLSTLGCRGEAASTAAAALQRVREKRYDVIFIDCQLPDMTGPQLAAAINAVNGESPDAPPMIATTACADEATREACRRAGMDGFIAKPVTPEKIRNAIAGRDHARLPASPMILPPVTPSPTPRIDLRQLRIIASDPAGLQEQARRVGELLETDLRSLGTAGRRGHLDAMRESAHRIVSHSRFIGAAMLAAIADEIQKSDDASAEVAIDLIEAAEREATRVLQELERATRPETASPN